MARPRKIKFVGFEPSVTRFKPQGIPMRELEEVTLTIDELETVRLSDVEGFSQAEAASMMDIHQSTFQRTLARARKKIGQALTTGKAIKIEGGDYEISLSRRPQHLGISKMHVECPGCGHTEEKERGVPASSMYCPNCRTRLRRKM